MHALLRGSPRTHGHGDAQSGTQRDFGEGFPTWHRTRLTPPPGAPPPPGPHPGGLPPPPVPTQRPLPSGKISLELSRSPRDHPNQVPITGGKTQSACWRSGCEGWGARQAPAWAAQGGGLELIAPSPFPRLGDTVSGTDSRDGDRTRCAGHSECGAGTFGTQQR